MVDPALKKRTMLAVAAWCVRCALLLARAVAALPAGLVVVVVATVRSSAPGRVVELFILTYCIYNCFPE